MTLDSAKIVVLFVVGLALLAVGAITFFAGVFSESAGPVVIAVVLGLLGLVCWVWAKRI